MTSRERVKKVLNFEEIDRFPRDLWYLPGIKMNREVELERVLKKFPSDIIPPVFSYGQGNRCSGNEYSIGHNTDAWGSLWYVGEQGVVGEVKGYPLADWSSLKNYMLPWELLENADFSRVNSSCWETDKFVLAGTLVRPFERMQFLRGTENLFIDMAYEDKSFFELKDQLHDFFLKEIEQWCLTEVDGISFMDDWGAQSSLLISPDMWRKYFKPLYKDYCDLIHSNGKYVFMHSDGFIEDIYPDLIEIGVDALNSQLFCMDMESLGEKYAGKITFWGELDRQHVLPFGDDIDVRKAVERVSGALLRGKRTGLISQFEWGIQDPEENIMTAFEEWGKY